jgi:hypothetical protein
VAGRDAATDPGRPGAAGGDGKAASGLGHRDADVALARLVLELAGARPRPGRLPGTGSAG